MKNKQKKPVIKLITHNWNKTDKKEQDKNLLFMHRVLSEMEQNRKFGYSNDFWANL